MKRRKEERQRRYLRLLYQSELDRVAKCRADQKLREGKYSFLTFPQVRPESCDVERGLLRCVETFNGQPNVEVSEEVA